MRDVIFLSYILYRPTAIQVQVLTLTVGNKVTGNLKIDEPLQQFHNKRKRMDETLLSIFTKFTCTCYTIELELILICSYTYPVKLGLFWAMT